jgi:large subunit ribosomal protein L9
MKVILLKDVPKVGRKYTAVDVADGYASNFLLPKKMAEPATKAKLAELAKRQEASRAADDARLTELKEKLERLAEETLSFSVKTDGQGHLFKKLRGDDIADLIKEEQGIEVAAESVLLNEPINEVGEYDIALDVSGIETTVKVEVVSE